VSVVERLRRVARNNSLGRALSVLVRPAFRVLRTGWLRWRNPDGGFVVGNGVRVYVDFRSPNYAWYDADAPNLAFDQKVIRAIIDQCEGSVFMDVGAHYGFYSAFLAQLLNDRARPARLIAVEPDTDNYRCLVQTMAGTPPPIKPELLQIALGDTDGEVTLQRSQYTACARTYRTTGSHDGASVPIRRLDSLAKEMFPTERVAFMKVDIDGAEPMLLRGGAELLGRDRPVIFMEFAPSQLVSAGVDPRDFFNTLLDSFSAYWVLWSSQEIRPVTIADYQRLADHAGDDITDLVLSGRPLDFSKLTA
jgi:FkbM family methyltransferase